MKKFHVVVKGVCPLLMHKFGSAATADLAATVKKRKSGPPDPKEEAEEGAYRLDKAEGETKGQLCLPNEHFLQSMMKAASGFQVQGQGKKTYKDATAGNLYVEPEYIGLTNLAGNKLFDYVIDMRPARIKAARINRCRPRLNEWRAEFVIVCTDEGAVPDSVINAILVSAGQTKGVGDYRPRFGRYMVEEFKELTADEAAAA